MAGMKRLVVCCDGTWNDADSGAGYTNVSRLAWAIMPTDTRNGGEIPQIVYYQSGVGTEGDLLSKIKGGGLGLGLSSNVRDAYTFLCNNYNEGDEIFLFGFSRGAYTARSIGGLIGYAGLIVKRDLDRFYELWDGYRTLKKPGHVSPLPNFEPRHKDVPIKCIGVWDTVGSLGVPGNIDFLFKDYYAFHNTDLGDRVQLARHALALDERREDFAPTLWTQKPQNAGRQSLKQVWFAGAHSDVGGGYPEHGLSDIPLAWMAGEVEDVLAIDFDYLKARRDVSSKWALGLLHDSVDGIFKARGKINREPLAAGRNNAFESIHPSVAERINGGAAALPGKYASAALAGINDLVPHTGKLSDREKALQWGSQDVKAGEKPAAKSRSIREKLLNLIGGG